jgi:hypothetical protein
MADEVTIQPFFCTQCGGELHPDQGQRFETCPYCQTTVFLDKTQVVFHWYLAPTLAQEQAQAALFHWMSGNDTVKDLDKKSSITDVQFKYFPLWYFKTKQGRNREQIFLEPAAAISISEIKRMRIQAGDLRKYDPSEVQDTVSPTVPLSVVKSWLGNRGIADDQIIETALVHLPFFTFKYSFGKKIFTAIVEAATGKVLANVFPEKNESPYELIATLTVGGFILLALLPLGGFLFGSEAGFGGIGLCTSLGIPFGILCFLLAAWIAGKV